MIPLVIWSLDTQRYALPLAMIVRVMRAIAITPLPDAPEIISGIVNIHGEVIPVVNLRRRLRLPPREAVLTDFLVLARGAGRPVAFLVDAMDGVTDYPDSDIVADVAPGMGCISAVVRLPDGMILINDLDRFLSLDEARVLEQALADAPIR